MQSVGSGVFSLAKGMGRIDAISFEMLPISPHATELARPNAAVPIIFLTTSSRTQTVIAVGKLLT